MDRGIWQATVHRVAKSQTRLSEHRAEHSGFPKDTQSCALSVHKHDNQAPGIPTQERGGKYRPIAQNNLQLDQQPEHIQTEAVAAAAKLVEASAELVIRI